MTTGSLRTAANAWQHFWFREIPPDVYALLRIGFGLIGLIALAGLTPVSMFWPIGSLSPVPGEGLGVRAQLLALGLGQVAGWCLFGGLVAAFTAMTVGWRSRITVPICFVGTVVQAHWNNLPLSAAHQVLIVLLFCLMWADTGTVRSLDRWLAVRRTPEHLATTQPIWPLRLLRAQVVLIYLGSGLWKLLDPAWRDGSAVHYVANNNVFHRLPYSIPLDAAWLLTVATFVTVVWELTFGLLVLHRWTRRVALLVGVVLHTGMWLLLELGPFSWLMMVSYVAFRDPNRWIRRQSPVDCPPEGDEARRRYGAMPVRPIAAGPSAP